MLCSQNKDLWDACDSGNVTRVKRLLSEGADPNHHRPGTGVFDVSCVESCSNRCVIHTTSVLTYSQ